MPSPDTTPKLAGRGCCSWQDAWNTPAGSDRAALIRPWYNKSLQTAIEAAMPIRKPIFNPPFNIVRASHVELGVRDLARSRAFYVDCLGYLVSAEEPEALYLRAVEERNHHSIVLRAGKAPAAHTLGFKFASEDDLDRAADWFAAATCRCRFPRRRTRAARCAPPIDRHAARLLFQDGPGRAHAATLRGLPGRPHPAHRSHQLLHAGRAGELRLFYRARLQADRIYRDRRRRSRLWAVWLHRKGNVHDLAFTNGARAAPASRRRLDGGRARAPSTSPT